MKLFGKKEKKKPNCEKKPIIVFDPSCPLTKSQKRIINQEGLKQNFKMVTLGTKGAEKIIKKMKLKDEKIKGNPTFIYPNYTKTETGLKGHNALNNFIKDSEKATKKDK